MKRSLVFALILAVGPASPVMAGETLLQSGKRITRQTVESRPAPTPTVLESYRLRINWAPVLGLQTSTGIAQSGMRKRAKIMIAVGITGAFAAVAMAIDRGVENTTPSSLGQR